MSCRITHSAITYASWAVGWACWTCWAFYCRWLFTFIASFAALNDFLSSKFKYTVLLYHHISNILTLAKQIFLYINSNGHKKEMSFSSPLLAVTFQVHLALRVQRHLFMFGLITPSSSSPGCYRRLEFAAVWFFKLRGELFISLKIIIWIRREDEYLKWVTFLFNEVQILYYSVWARLCRRWDLLQSCSAWDQPTPTCPATPRYRGCPRPNSPPADSPSPTGVF